MGLIDYLRGDCKLEDATGSFAEIPCWIMPAGVSETDPTELLKSDRLEWVFSQDARKIRLCPSECSTHPPCGHNECAGKTCGLVTAGGQSQSNVSTSCETRFGFTKRIEADSSDSQCSGEPVFALLYERLHDDRESAACLIWRSAFRLHSSGVLRAEAPRSYTL